MPIVEADNGQSYDFPDGTTPTQMTEYLMKVAPPKQSQQQSPLDAVNNNLSSLAQSNPVTAPLAAVAQMHPINDLRDVAQGALQGGVNAAKLLSSVSPSLQQKISSILPGAENEISKVGSGNDTTESNLAQGLGQYLPFAPIGEIGAPTSLLGKMIAQGSAGFASGAANAQPGQSKLMEGIKDALLNQIAPVGGKILEALRPANSLRGTLTPEQLMQNVEAAKGTSTGLGDVIADKTLKNALETQLPSFPGTGATDAMLNTANQVRDKGAGLFGEMLGGNSPDNVMQPLQDALRANKKEVIGEKVAKQNALNKAADEGGLQIGRENQQAYAQNKLDDINEDQELKSYVPNEVIQDLQDQASGKFGPQKLKAADISGGSTALGSKANSYYRAGNDYAGGIYNGLADAKQADVEDALNNTSNDHIKTLRDDYREFYANEYAPYLDKDVQKFTAFGRGDVDLLLKQFMKTSGPTDRPMQLSKLMNRLKPNQTNLVRYAYYSPAFNAKTGAVDLGTLKSLHEGLGAGQKDVLFQDNPQLMQKMDKTVHAININPEPMRALANPQTGNRTSSFAPIAAMMTGAKIGFKHLGIPGAVLGAAAGIAAPATAGRALTKTLTSESVRNNVVKAMLENKVKFGTKNQTRLGNTLAQALFNAQQRGQ